MRGAVTRRSLVHDDGGARLYRYRGPRSPSSDGPAVLLVPSMLQRATVLDLAPGASLVEALTEAGLAVYGLDWGAPHELDRFFDLDDAVDRLRRARRAIARLGGAGLALVGYSQGGTLAAIEAALRPEGVTALVTLAGPVDFARAGPLADFVDRRWCDADAIADAGPVSSWGFRGLVAALAPAQALRPHVRAVIDPDAGARAIWRALVRWADDPVSVPAEVYRAWVKSLYQDNALARGALRVRGEAVRLERVTAPVLIVSPERDDVCPPAAATALGSLVGSARVEVMRVPGGHVSGIVGPGAREHLHLPLARWLIRHATRASSAAVAAAP